MDICNSLTETISLLFVKAKRINSSHLLSSSLSNSQINRERLIGENKQLYYVNLGNESLEWKFQDSEVALGM